MSVLTLTYFREKESLAEKWGLIIRTEIPTKAPCSAVSIMVAARTLGPINWDSTKGIGYEGKSMEKVFCCFIDNVYSIGLTSKLHFLCIIINQGLVAIQMGINTSEVSCKLSLYELFQRISKKKHYSLFICLLSIWFQNLCAIVF